MKKPFSFNFINELSAGCIISVDIIMTALVYTVSLFTDISRNDLSIGLFIAFLSSIVLIVFISLGSSSKIMVGGLQETYVIAGSLLVASILEKFRLYSPQIDPFPTVMLALALLTFTLGSVIYLLGRFRLGNLVRSIPYPVIGGFLAGVGWFLLLIGFSVISQQSLLHFPSFYSLSTFAKWELLISFIYALVILIIARKWDRPFNLSILVLGAIGLFYLFLYVNGLTRNSASHFFIETNGAASIQFIFHNHFFSDIQWSILLQNSVYFGLIFLLGPIDLLLNLTGFEEITQKDLNINKDLKTAGMANWITALFGGLGGYQLLGLSVANYKLKADTRLPVIICLSVLIGLLIFKLPLLNYIPRFIVAAFFMYLGLDLLTAWLIDGWKKFSFPEYVVVLIILFGIIFFNLVVGFIIGLLLVSLQFVFQYNKTNSIKLAVSGDTIKSNVSRNFLEEEMLKIKGNKGFLIELQGFLNFGNMVYLFRKIKERIKASPALEYLMMDWRYVTNVDSSAIRSLIRIFQLRNQQHFHIAFFNLKPMIQKRIDQLLSVYGITADYYSFPDQDRGLEWFEEKILNDSKKSLVKEDTRKLIDLISLCSEIEKKGFHFKRINFSKNELIANLGAPGNCFYIIEQGEVEALLPSKNGDIRLRSMRTNTMIGEMGLFLGIPRSATLRANKETTLIEINANDLKALEKNQPVLALELHKQIIRILCLRLNYSNQLILQWQMQ